MRCSNERPSQNRIEKIKFAISPIFLVYFLPQFASKFCKNLYVFRHNRSFFSSNAEANPSERNILCASRRSWAFFSHKAKDECKRYTQFFFRLCGATFSSDVSKEKSNTRETNVQSLVGPLEIFSLDPYPPGSLWLIDYRNHQNGFGKILIYSIACYKAVRKNAFSLSQWIPLPVAIPDQCATI